MSDLKALSASAVNRYSYNGPDPTLLETFPNPAGAGQEMVLRIEVPEFTSLCPITGQPDFAKIIIQYIPRALCVESKSLKMYLMGYRMHGAFHESCVAQIAQDLWDAMNKPQWLQVQGQFTPRGGIPFWPTVTMGS